MESEGIASLSTAASLAATYGIPLLQLQETLAVSEPRPFGRGVVAVFYLGVAVLMLAAVGCLLYTSRCV